MLNPLTYLLILALVCGYAFLRGTSEARIAAAICVAASVASAIVASRQGVPYSSIELGIFIVDLAVLIGFTAIALRTDRFWPLWLSGLQLTTIIAHLFKAANIDLIPQVYAAAARFWVYPIFLIIVVGTWRGHRRRQQERAAFALP